MQQTHRSRSLSRSSHETRRRSGLRGTAAVAGAVLLASGVAACGSSSSSSASGSNSAASWSPSRSGTTNVTIAYTAPTADQILPVVAKAGGFFKKNGINVTLKFLSPSAALPALISGSVNFVVMGAPAAEIGAVNGTPLEYVGQWEKYIDAQIVANKDAATIKDLNNKTVAISSTGALSDFLAQISNHQNGITMHEVPLGSFPDEITAFEKGSAAALSGANPWQLKTLKKLVPSTHVVEDFRSNPSAVGVGVIADSQKLSSTAAHNTTVKVLRALYQAIPYYKSHESVAVPLIAKTDSYTTAEATEAYQDVKKATDNTVVPDLASEKSVLTALSSSQPAAKGFDASKLFDPSYATKAQSGS
ncbi:MAG: ABC transporter substrate-binding protein [Solirubrobacterales bacterium]|nr:ABC transporter substrate-binding protein [Solirubrobacterales bacterium]